MEPATAGSCVMAISVTSQRLLLCSIFVLAIKVSAGAAPEALTDSASDSLRGMIRAPGMMSLDNELAPRVIISIDTLLVDDMTFDDSIDVIVETQGIEMAACQLKLAVASRYLDIVAILPGEMIDSCKWDMFKARQTTPVGQEGAPREIWQITAIAQGMSDKKAPVCYGLKRPAIFARLVVSGAHSLNEPDTTAAIFFYWESCRDNVISDRQGSSILISDTVLDRLPVSLETDRDKFPTRFGSLGKCVSHRAAEKPRRLVEFRNGGVRLRAGVDR